MYRNSNYKDKLYEHIKWHVENGYIFAGPDFFLMGSAVGNHGWFIHIAIGKNRLQKFLSLMPYDLPHIGFSRDPSGSGTIVWYDTDKFVKHL